MSPLFAHQAGIVGLEAAEGGIDYDKDAAYAVVLRGSGDVEIEAASESKFTYRCKQSDKGRYKLTAATPKSRKPIRVLRCHSLNSIWGPKAGIRYEGLYKVVGWAIYTAKTDDVIGKQHRAGDILYEVTFERIDTVPMAEVLKHPTAAELDDYAEYKRLRRVHREEMQKTGSDKPAQVTSKNAPQVAPATSGPSHWRPSVSRPSPGRSVRSGTYTIVPVGPYVLYPRSANSGFPNFNWLSDGIIPGSSEGTTRYSPQVSNVSSLRGLDTLNLGQQQRLAVDAMGLRGGPESPRSEVSFKLHDQQRSPQRAGSAKSSQHGAETDIREVVPWIDYEVSPTSAADSAASPVPGPNIQPRRGETYEITGTPPNASTSNSLAASRFANEVVPWIEFDPAADSTVPSTMPRPRGTMPQEGPSSNPASSRNNEFSGMITGMRSRTRQMSVTPSVLSVESRASNNISSKAASVFGLKSSDPKLASRSSLLGRELREGRDGSKQPRPGFGRARNPLAKLFDGTYTSAIDDSDVYPDAAVRSHEIRHQRRRAYSASSCYRKRHRLFASFSSDTTLGEGKITTDLHSPVPLRPMSPLGLLEAIHSRFPEPEDILGFDSLSGLPSETSDAPSERDETSTPPADANTNATSDLVDLFRALLSSATPIRPRLAATSSVTSFPAVPPPTPIPSRLISAPRMSSATLSPVLGTFLLSAREGTVSSPQISPKSSPRGSTDVAHAN